MQVLVVQMDFSFAGSFQRPFESALATQHIKDKISTTIKTIYLQLYRCLAMQRTIPLKQVQGQRPLDALHTSILWELIKELIKEFYLRYRSVLQGTDFSLAQRPLKAPCTLLSRDNCVNRMRRVTITKE